MPASSSTIEKNVEAFVEDLGLPEIAIGKVWAKEDILPTDPSNISGEELSNKLFEYSAYVSYLDAELGRLDAMKVVISSELERETSFISQSQKLSKPKARALLLSQEPLLQGAEERLVELEATYARVMGIRSGFHIRLQACSREVSRRSTSP